MYLSISLPYIIPKTKPFSADTLTLHVKLYYDNIRAMNEEVWQIEMRVAEGKMVGATRFELVTFCTPSKRATRLRYAPTMCQKRHALYQNAF